MLHDDLTISQSLGLVPSDATGQRLTEIFNHPWHWIFKNQADPTWQTETRYPIKPFILWRLWQDASTLIGVRFGNTAHYGLIDIDINSIYHPNQDPTAINGIICALESIGIYRVLIVRSSESGGIHIYIPLAESIATYGLALALKFCCEDAGYGLAPGQLEIFPNCKVYRTNAYTNYNGHRLPLQSGSYLLNAEFEPITNDLQFFLKAWELAAGGNDHHELNEAIARYKDRPRPYLKRTGKGEQWRSDCQDAISQGWTGHGQTNELIGTFAQYGRVFLALSGDELIEWLINTVITAPGYEQWCRHKHEIDRRCRDWARDTERFYYPYPSHVPRSGNPWGRSDANDEKAASALDRIKTAYSEVGKLAFRTVADLASSITAIAKCSLATLYKYRRLWHPDSFKACNDCKPDTAPDIDDTQDSTQELHKSLEPLPQRSLHTRCPKKVLIRVMDSDQEIYLPEIRLETPQPQICLRFSDRTGPTTPENPCIEGDTGLFGDFFVNGDKNSQIAPGSTALCAGCCFEHDKLGCELEIAIGACPNQITPPPS